MARIVIVDDNLLCRTLLRRILSDAGHEVVGEAQDGVEAPARVHELRPELVTLDLGDSGLTRAQTLRTTEPI